MQRTFPCLAFRCSGRKMTSLPWPSDGHGLSLRFQCFLLRSALYALQCFWLYAFPDLYYAFQWSPSFFQYNLIPFYFITTYWLLNTPSFGLKRRGRGMSFSHLSIVSSSIAKIKGLRLAKARERDADELRSAPDFHSWSWSVRTYSKGVVTWTKKIFSIEIYLTGSLGAPWRYIGLAGACLPEGAFYRVAVVRYSQL